MYVVRIKLARIRVLNYYRCTVLNMHGVDFVCFFLVALKGKLARLELFKWRDKNNRIVYNPCNRFVFYCLDFHIFRSIANGCKQFQGSRNECFASFESSRINGVLWALFCLKTFHLIYRQMMDKLIIRITKS